MTQVRNVRDHIPLEQGLRLPRRIHWLCLESSQRPYSIRTRIKTERLLDAAEDSRKSETIFH